MTDGGEIAVKEPTDGERTGRVPGEAGPDSHAPDADTALSVYLNDHLAGSAAGVRLARRCEEAHRGSDLGRYLETLVGEIEEDRRVLERVMSRVGARSNPVKQAGALGAEVLARLKNVTPVFGSGPTTARLEEIELLSLGIEGKRLLWGLLNEMSTSDDRLREFDFAALEEGAKKQRDDLEPFRIALGVAACGRTGVP
jgi:hypothetical protein